MQKVIFQVLYLLGKFASLLLPYTILRYFHKFVHLVYSGFISKYFKRVGKGFLVHYPCHHYGLSNITVGDNFVSFGRLRIETFDGLLNTTTKPELFIGHNVSLNYDCHIGCVNKIVIGNNVLIASRVYITDHFHGDTSYESLATPPSLRPVTSKGPIIIEDNVWIGEGVSIMPNVNIGKNTIIGANSVVTKSFPANCVIGGVPAKIIKIIKQQ